MERFFQVVYEYYEKIDEFVGAKIISIESCIECFLKNWIDFM